LLKTPLAAELAVDLSHFPAFHRLDCQIDDGSPSGRRDTTGPSASTRSVSSVSVLPSTDGQAYLKDFEVCGYPSR
jgi:hypothetical protein